MRTEVETDRFSLEPQPLDHWPVGHVRQAQGLHLASVAEQADLARRGFLGLRLRPAQDRFRTDEHARTTAFQPVERAGLCQILKLHLVKLARIDPRCEIGEISERASAARLRPPPASPPFRPSSPPPARNGFPAFRHRAVPR